MVNQMNKKEEDFEEDFNPKLTTRTESTFSAIRHEDEQWHEANFIWNWKRQGKIVVWCQKAPWLFLPPSIVIHFVLKRDWGMAIGPFFAFAIFADVRSLDLMFAASFGGVLCGIFKHLMRSPRPFWIVPEVVLKEGVEEMSWGTPSAHSAIQGSITAVLIYYDYKNGVTWIVNILILLFTMFSRLFLAVHWPQDVLSGALIGVLAGYTVCSSQMHKHLLYFAEDNHRYGGFLYLSVGVAYNIFVFVVVKLLDRISNNRPVPKAAIRRYQIGVARALRILAGESNEQDSKYQIPQNSEISDAEKGDANISSGSKKYDTGKPVNSLDIITKVSPNSSNSGLDRRVSWVIPEMKIPEEQDNNLRQQSTVSEISHFEKGDSNISSDIQKTSTEIPTNVPGTINNRQNHRVSYTGSHRSSPSGTLVRKRSSITGFGTLPSFADLETMGESEFSETMEMNDSAYYFKNITSILEHEKYDAEKKLERGVFLRTDVAFDPDSKARFWYNSVNVMGCYAGLAMYSCTVSEKNVEFKPTYKVAAALYATGITFSLIVYTRTVLRSMLNRTHFKVVRKFVYFFIGIFTYGLFPLSYTGLKNNIENS